jgi:hypothetical protein
MIDLTELDDDSKEDSVDLKTATEETILRRKQIYED